jgi:hypothetical protein
MSVDCIILDQAACEAVRSRDNEGNFIERGYLNNSELRPVQRQGATGGNPDPCYILNIVVLTNADFATAQPYLSGLPVKTFPDDPTFPPIEG